MKLEEVRCNIGNKVKRKENGLVISGDMIIHSFKEDNGKVFVNIRYHEKSTCHMVVDAKDIELSEKPMKKYKIRVTPETSGEVQKLFFALGYSWSSNINQPKYLNDRFLYTENGLISATNDYGMFIDNPAKGITLPELRKLGLDSKNEYGFETEIERHEVEPHNKKAKGFFDNWKTKEMTWQDALRAVADGKEIEFYNDFSEKWHCIKGSYLYFIIDESFKFRLKPQTTHIEGGDYTKEELLKIAGEM